MTGLGLAPLAIPHRCGRLAVAARGGAVDHPAVIGAAGGLPDRLVISAGLQHRGGGRDRLGHHHRAAIIAGAIAVTPIARRRRHGRLLPAGRRPAAVVAPALRRPVAGAITVAAVRIIVAIVAIIVFIVAAIADIDRHAVAIAAPAVAIAVPVHAGAAVIDPPPAVDQQRIVIIA